MGKAENYVEKYLVKKVNDAGGLCYKLSASIINGIPDRLVVLNKTIFVETKSSVGKTTKRQDFIHNQITNCGGKVFTISNRKQVDNLIKELLNDKEK